MKLIEVQNNSPRLSLGYGEGIKAKALTKGKMRKLPVLLFTFLSQIIQLTDRTVRTANKPFFH